MNQLALLLRALWWRRGLSAATLFVAAVTIGAGSLGPLYARAADESTLRDRLTASAADAALHYTFPLDLNTDADLAATVAHGPTPGSIKAYPRTLVAVTADAEARTAKQNALGDSGVLTRVIWREGQCGHFVLVRGRCPSKAGEAIASERTLAGDYYGWSVGTRLTLPNLRRDEPDGRTTPVQLTVVGSYRLRDAKDSFWQGRTYFDAHPGVGGGNVPDHVDGLFVDRSQLDLLAKPTSVSVQVDYPIAADRVTLADTGKLRSDVAALSSLRSDAGPGVDFTTGVTGVLAAASAEQRLVNLSTLLVSLQLAVLAWLVLFQVIADAVEAKGSEIALAKLRGLAPFSTVRFGLAEPMLLVALATPVGLFGGWLGVRVLASSVLLAGTPVNLTSGTLIAVAAALAGSLVAAVAAGRRTLRRSVLEQWRRTPGHHPSRWMLALDLVLAAAAITGLVLLRRSTGRDGHPHAATLLAPAMLVFAVALLGMRLLPLVLRPLLPATRGTQRIGLFLAARQVVRRPAGLRLAALLTVAVGLATFAVAGEGVAQSNQARRARVEIGAARTAPVQFEPAHDPVAATRQVDPDGRWAMATASWLPDGGSSVTGQVLAVDSRRLVSTAFTRDIALTGRQLAGYLLPGTVPSPLAIRASAVRVTIAASRLSPGNTPTVLLNLRGPGTKPLDVRAGSLRPGTAGYQANVACEAGCTLTGITWDRPIDTFDDLTGTTLVSRIEIKQQGTWRTLDAGLTRGSDWRQATQLGNAGDQLSAGPAGLTDSYHSRAGGSAGIAHSDSPRPLPVVTTPNGVVLGPNAPHPLQMADNTHAAADVAVAAVVPVLPSVLDQGLLVDLPAVRAQLPAFDTEATWSIWLGPQAPADAIARLTAAGLTLQPGPSERGRLTELKRQGPALALRLLVVCAIAGAVLAVGGTAVAIASTGRRRSFELASLRAIGISRRALLRASMIEQLLLLGAALVLGVPAGYLAARLSMPSIPEFADPTPVALHYQPALTGVLLFALAFLLLLSLTSVLAGRALMRAAAPSRLREAE